MGQDRDAVEDFMAERRPAVLDRAIQAIAECDIADMETECHRLRGTLASYDLTSAAELVEVLESIARQSHDDPSAVETARALTVSGLEGIAESLASSP